MSPIYIAMCDAGECFVVADARTGYARVVSFDSMEWELPRYRASNWDDLMYWALLRFPAGIEASRATNYDGKPYTAMQSYADCMLTACYAELNDTALFPNQRVAWALDPQQEW